MEIMELVHQKRAAANHEVNINGVNITTTVADASWLINSFINELRPSLYDGNIDKKRVIGLDIEWNSNSNDNNDKVATLQLCYGDRCIIIQLLHLDLIPFALSTLLIDQSISFVGVGITEDLSKLECDYGLESVPGIELGQLADKVLGKQQFSGSGLVELACEIVGLSIEKPASASCSDWGLKNLTSEQIKYATIDAYASFVIGSKLLEGGNN
ncbi:3'-5' exonuclease domain [Macleaya cordata]|uniref:3'-5' exonuclease domain n=1 Tax=Macleaya cordata TaxID=56857 RepID=A0A200R224_MACCD|nr:3'-5' exonuclease domain [Macleaya cordata]